MADDRYIIYDQHGTYFLTFTIVKWIDVFTRPEYKMVIVEAMNYCQEHKGMEYFAWVLMSNHMHLIARAHAPHGMSEFVRDFKKFTSKKITGLIDKSAESRREWMLRQFSVEAQQTGRAENYKLWQDGYHALALDESPEWLDQKIRYIHDNPVRQMIVSEPKDYTFSSASDYSGRKGLVEVTVLSPTSFGTRTIR